MRMLRFVKYLIYFLVLLSLILLYLLLTPSGHQHIYNFIGKQLSHEAGLDVQVQSMDVTNYPQTHLVLHIEKKAKLTLYGYLDTERLDMNYTLTSDCIASEYCEIEDDISIDGTIKGLWSKLQIRGKGYALDGNVSYAALKYPDKAENILLQMTDVNSSKLFKLMGEESLIAGKADVNLHFAYMDKQHKKGAITYHVKAHNFQGLTLALTTHIDIEDDHHTFNIDLNATAFTLYLQDGTYNQKEKKAHAHYLLQIEDLRALEQILGYTYRGSLDATGEVSYATYLKITGVTSSFGGKSHFLFEKEKLHITLNKSNLQDILSLFSIPHMLDATATGEIEYHLISKILTAKTKLTQAHFVPCTLSDALKKKAGIDLLKERFDNAHLNLVYHNKVIQGELKLANDHSHLFLTNTLIDTHLNTLDAYFDLKMQGEEFSGKVYGSLDSPKINLNLQKLMRYQMDKQVDKMIGKNNRKIMENLPMGGVAKDVATDMGASFMKVFF